MSVQSFLCVPLLIQPSFAHPWSRAVLEEKDDAGNPPCPTPQPTPPRLIGHETRRQAGPVPSPVPLRRAARLATPTPAPLGPGRVQGRPCLRGKRQRRGHFHQTSWISAALWRMESVPPPMKRGPSSVLPNSPFFLPSSFLALTLFCRGNRNHTVPPPRLMPGRGNRPHRTSTRCNISKFGSPPPSSAQGSMDLALISTKMKVFVIVPPTPPPPQPIPNPDNGDDYGATTMAAMLA